MDKQKLSKRYKSFRWVQYISFILSIIACIVPVIVSCLRAVPSMERDGGRWAICGVGVFFAAIIALEVCRSLVQKFIMKIPYTLTVLISVGAMLGLIFCLEQIIDDAMAVLLVGLMGAAIGFVLELISILCKALADDIEEFYKRGKYDV